MTKLLRNTEPALMAGAKILASEILGIQANPWSSFWYVDGDGGSSSASGNVPEAALDTIQGAVTAAGRGDLIYIRPKAMASGATDPANYTENIVIPAATDGLSLIGASFNRTQGGLPQLKVGTTTTSAILTIRTPGVYIAGIGINGADATGGGILLDDDGSTKTAFGTTIESCHFKNCKGTTATNAATGGAIQLSGAPWQVRIRGNEFYKNVGGIVLKDTSNSVPQDLVIEDNIFAGTAATVDCDIYLAGGSGAGTGLMIRNNDFASVDAPQLSSGTNQRFVDLTGADGGLFSGNNFACLTGPTGQTELTFGIAGTAGKIPAAVRIADNYGESLTAGETGEIDRTD